MATLRLSARALEHLERIFEFAAEKDPDLALVHIQKIRKAIEVLDDHPLIGRPAEEGRRELVISRGRDTFLALYRFRPSTDEVLVLAVRHAREAGYRDM